MSISAEGSVKGKKLGRNLRLTSGENILWANVVRTPFRSAKVTFSSTRNPSTWWNMGEWETSASHR